MDIMQKIVKALNKNPIQLSQNSKKITEQKSFYIESELNSADLQVEISNIRKNYIWLTKDNCNFEPVFALEKIIYG